MSARHLSASPRWRELGTMVGIVWRILLHPNGVMTGVVRLVVPVAEINWLDNPTLSQLSMIMINAWTIIPFYMLICAN